MQAETNKVGNVYDLLDSRVLANPYPLYHRLRAEDPVHWNEDWGCWILTRYTDVLESMKDSRLSNARIIAYLDQLPETVRQSLKSDSSEVIKEIARPRPPQGDVSRDKLLKDARKWFITGYLCLDFLRTIVIHDPYYRGLGSDHTIGYLPQTLRDSPAFHQGFSGLPRKEYHFFLADRSGTPQGSGKHDFTGFSKVPGKPCSAHGPDLARPE